MEADTEFARSADDEVGWSGSPLIETVARGRGMSVRRLSTDIIICSDGGVTVAFRGLAGPSSGRVAHALCRNHPALHSQLRSRGVRVSTPVGSARVQVAVVGGRAVAVSPAVEDDGTEGVRDAAEELAIRAVGAIPGLGYASIVVVRVGEQAPAVSAVDPKLLWWARSAGESAALVVVKAILDYEYGGPALGS